LKAASDGNQIVEKTEDIEKIRLPCRIWSDKERTTVESSIHGRKIPPILQADVRETERFRVALAHLGLSARIVSSDRSSLTLVSANQALVESVAGRVWLLRLGRQSRKSPGFQSVNLLRVVRIYFSVMVYELKTGQSRRPNRFFDVRKGNKVSVYHPKGGFPRQSSGCNTIDLSPHCSLIWRIPPTEYQDGPEIRPTKDRSMGADAAGKVFSGVGRTDWRRAKSTRKGGVIMHCEWGASRHDIAFFVPLASGRAKRIK
jgi:hypothetical protein